MELLLDKLGTDVRERYAFLKGRYHLRHHPVALKARNWLRMAHESRKCCLIVFNYGPVLVEYNFVEKLYDDLLASSAFKTVMQSELLQKVGSVDWATMVVTVHTL